MTKRWKNRPEGSTWGDFGEDDQTGRLALLTPERVRRAAAECRALISALEELKAADQAFMARAHSMIMSSVSARLGPANTGIKSPPNSIPAQVKRVLWSGDFLAINGILLVISSSVKSFLSNSTVVTTVLNITVAQNRLQTYLLLQ